MLILAFQMTRLQTKWDSNIRAVDSEQSLYDTSSGSHGRPLGRVFLFGRLLGGLAGRQLGRSRSSTVLVTEVRLLSLDITPLVFAHNDKAKHRQSSLISELDLLEDIH